MKTRKKPPSKLIKQIMLHRRCDQDEAETWADRYCGDWRNTPLPRAKRIKSISSNEKEWEK